MKRSLRGVRTAVCGYAVAVLLILSLAVCSGTAEAQTFRGTILGTVTDPTGASVAGATVTVKNLGTGLTRTMSTTEDGGYSAPELPIGNYSVTVEKPGFKSGVVKGIQVEVSSEIRADVTLQPGEIAQTVEVSGDVLPQVDSTENTLGGIIESKIVTNLPVNGRDYTKLIFLVPGVAGSPDQITDSAGSFGTFSVNGARGRANNFLLDGTDMNDGYRNDPAINEAGVFGTPATILPVESIAELRVASNFESEYGRSAGAVINIVTKSGTNNLHGTAFEFLRNTVGDARNYFNPAPSSTSPGSPKGPFHNNQFGGSLGGPIIKDKTFFFLDYEGLREKGAESSPACVPTTADIAANTPATGINPVVAQLLARNPWPQPTNTNPATNDCYQNSAFGPNASLATPFSNRVDSGIVKVDQQISKDNLLTGRYYIGDSDQSFPLALTGGGLLPQFDTTTPTRVQLVAISYVTTISPSVISEARVGWNRFVEGFFPADRNFDPRTIGLDTIGSSPTNGVPFNFGLPFISVASPSGIALATLGSDKGDPRDRVDTNWHYIENISWKAGKHDMKFGYEFRRTSISQTFNRGFRGTLSFSSFGDFLAGMPTGGGSLREGNTNRNTFENSHAIYFQDGFHVTRRVTLNLGVRYDYFGLIQEKHGNFTNINSITGVPFVVGQGRLYQPDYKNVAPRVSVAWDLTGRGKTVVRAGYGIFYDSYSQDMFIGHLPLNSAFDPGPAYSGFGPNPISVASVIPGAAFASGVPIYGFAGQITDAFGVDQRIRTPYMQNFNLNFQQEIVRNVVAQVGYVGSTGHKLLRFRDLNQPTQANITANPVNSAPFTLNPAFVFINYEETSANSSYNSLQASLRVNDWHGLTTTLNYVWSHSLDDASDGEDYVPNASQPSDSHALLRFNRGGSNFDIRNRLTWNFIYQLPTLSSNMKRLTGGWGVNGIVTVQSGQPFQLNYTEGNFDGSGEFLSRPDLVGPIAYHQNDPNNYLDLTAFAVPCAIAGGSCQLVIPGTTTPCAAIGPNCINSQHFGNLGRNSLIGPHFRQFDFSVFKQTPITERLKLELRLEAYNVLNHPNFANPYNPNGLADGAPNGFLPTGQSRGALRLTTTGDVGVGYPFLGGGGPRTLQVAAKFTF